MDVLWEELIKFAAILDSKVCQMGIADLSMLWDRLELVVALPVPDKMNSGWHLARIDSQKRR